MDLTIKMDVLYEFLLVLARTATVIGVMPVFGRRNVPAQIKILFAVVLSLLISVWNTGPAGIVVASDLSLVLLAAREVFIGLILGGVASFVFWGVEYAGELAGMQMGFAIAGILDPQTGAQVSIISKFQGTLAILLFLAISGHYFVLKALMDSFRLFPVGDMAVNLGAAMTYVQLAGKVFVIALRIAAPATILLFLINVGMGVIARMVPQMNVFIIGFPLMIMVGLFMLIIAMPAFITLAQSLMESMYDDFVVVLKAL